MGLGSTELIIILVIALVVFGPSRLPGLGKSMGEAIRGFKKGMDGDPEEKREQIRATPGSDSSAEAEQKQKEKT